MGAKYIDMTLFLRLNYLCMNDFFLSSLIFFLKSYWSLLLNVFSNDVVWDMNCICKWGDPYASGKTVALIRVSLQYLPHIGFIYVSFIYCILLLNKFDFELTFLCQLRVLANMYQLSAFWPGASRCQTLQWRHNEHDGVSNHRRLECLLNRLSRRSSKKTSKFRVTGLCEGNSPVTGEFPPQMASNAQIVSIWWCHHGKAGVTQ